MKRVEFINEIRKRLSALPESEIERSAAFYDEAISDRMDKGMTEEQAVAAIGDPVSAANQLIEIIGTDSMEAAEVGSEKEKSAPWKSLIMFAGLPLWLLVLIMRPFRTSKSRKIAKLILIIGIPIWFVLLVCLGAAALGALATVIAVNLSLYAAAAVSVASLLVTLQPRLDNMGGDVGTALFYSGCWLFTVGAAIVLVKIANWMVRQLARGAKAIWIFARANLRRKES